MAESLFSPSWYRVAQLKPRLRGHTQIHRHQYRGELWYVLQDHAKGYFYRFTPATYQFLGRMNGRQTVQQLWDRVVDLLGDDAPTQDEVVQLLSQLHSSDVLISDVVPDTRELRRRSKKIERSQFIQKIRSPLAVRFPLLDPDRFLSATVWIVRPLFSWFGFVAWHAIIATAVVQAALHWPELTNNIVDRVLSGQNLLIMGLAYPIIKAFHELGHGYAVKVWGGECHEIGIMLLVLFPVPYVDASAASEFRSKRRRIVVGSAGMLIELLLAAIALFLWIELEPGTMRSLAYNVVFIGSVSTLLFNGNPLLRYDGYYVLADMIEISNLSKRGTGFLGYLVKRHAFGVERAQRPHTGPGEPFWFVSYSIAAFLYRIVIYTGIVLFLVGKFFFIGILLALWAAFGMVAVPLFKGVKFLTTNPILRESRTRAIAVTALVVALLALLLFAVPVPSRTRAEGVVWAPKESLLRAGTAGFVRHLVADPDSMVQQGQVIVECYDPLLESNAAVVRARREEVRSRYDAALTVDRVQAQILQRELTDVEDELRRAEERLTELVIRSPRTGRLVIPDAADLADRYLPQGSLIGFVMDVERPMLRVVVPQSNVDRVRNDTLQVDVKLAEHLERTLAAEIRREVPEAEQRLPSTILGSSGGGAIAVDPTEQSGTKTFERMFQFDVELTVPLEDVYLGGRAYVRFDHGYEPIGFQLYRRLRQLFLRRFNI